jgi:hypothetical protein
MSRIDEAVSVLVDQEGVPTLFRWREKDYQVSSRPVRWFARTEWWVGERAHRGIGSGAIEVEMWRLIVAESGVLELSHTPSTKSWILVHFWDISD